MQASRSYPYHREGQYFMLMLNFETSGGSNPRSSLKKNWLACQPGVLPVIPLSFIKSLFIKFRPSLLGGKHRDSYTYIW